MTITTDNFARANEKPIASPWTNIIDVLNLISHGFAPVGSDHAAASGTAARLSDGIYLPTQISEATIKSIAGPLATMNLTAVVFAAGSSTYTYSNLIGTPIFTNMDIVVGGMQNPANDGDFVVTAKTGGPAAGTFTVVNASGVNEVGSTGAGAAGSDSLCGVAVRVTPDGQGYYALVGTNTGEQGGAQDSRIYAVEMWCTHLLGGIYVNTFISDITPPTIIPDAPGDVYKMTASGTTITLLKNGVAILTHTDVFGQRGGYPGISAQALSNDIIPVGNDGTVWTDWTGSDGVPTIVKGWKGMAADWFSCGDAESLPSEQWSAATDFGALVPPASAALMVGDGTCYDGSGLYTGRTWANDQASSIAAAAVTGVASLYVLARSDATGNNTYVAGFGYNSGAFGAGNVITCFKVVSGSVVALTSYTVGAISVPATISLNDVLRLEVQGTTVSVYHNGTLVTQGTDASLASGVPGFQATPDTFLNYWQGDEFIPTFSLSGSAGTPGATVSYSGTFSGSVISDASGNYTIPGLLNGSYTITPRKAGYLFVPSSLSVTLSGSDSSGNNFSARLLDFGGGGFGLGFFGILSSS